MLSIQKILFPIVFTDTSRRVVDQVGWLARRFKAEVILLHVVPPIGYPAVLEGGYEIAAMDLHGQIHQQAQKDLDHALETELHGISVTRVLLKGDPAEEIVQAARYRNVNLIAMSTHGHGAFYRFLLGSVAAKVLHECRCPVWTGAHLEGASARDFSIRRVLCAVNLSPHSQHTVPLAAQMAAAVDATLTLVHITSSVERYGAGGSYVDPAWKETIVGIAAKEIGELQRAVGTKAEVIIESGDVTEQLNRVAARLQADVLVIGHIPGRSHLGDNGDGYGIIRASQIPVLSL